MITSLLPPEARFRLNSEGADIRSQNVLTFMAFRVMRRRRIAGRAWKSGDANLAGVSTSKRPVFWMVLAIAVACSVLRERATFAIAFGRSERTLFCSFVFMLHIHIVEPISHFM